MPLHIKQEYELVRIDTKKCRIQEHPANPKKGVVEAIEESIEVNGWYGAVTAQKSTGNIIAGNHRFRAAKAQKAREIPVIWVDVDDETAKRILLADNQIADLGTYDQEILTELIDSLESIDGTGYGLQWLQMQEEAEAEGDDGSNVPEPDEIEDDRYTPQYAIILVVGTEERQRQMYEWLQGGANLGDEVGIRLVAV